MDSQKVALITGATDGIGRATAEALLDRGFTVVIVGRNQGKTEAVLNEMRGANPSRKLNYLLGDLSLMSDVRKVAREFRCIHRRLDVLINNAGGYFPQKMMTPEGLEYTFALNHMAYFIMTAELKDLLAATPGARVIILASRACRLGWFNFDDLQFEHRPYQGVFSYCQSKLANLVFAIELAERFKGTATVNAICPGTVGSRFFRNVKNPLAVALLKIASPFLKTPQKGAETTIYLATDKKVSSITGRFFFNRRRTWGWLFSRGPETRRRLWEISEKIGATL